MNLNLSGKRVLVTGSSQGIGRCIAEAFLSEGCKVAINGRNLSRLKNVIHEIDHPDLIAISGDVSKPNEAQKIREEFITNFGNLDILICNVGSGQSVPPGEENLNEWHRVFEQNLWSATTIIEVCRQDLANSLGAIVCISSICGHEVVIGAPITYSAAKAALNAYVRGSARPLGNLGIRINAISPGNILFEDSSWDLKQKSDAKSVEEMLRKNVALERFGSPQDIANLALWLASSMAGFTTGSIFVADGGQLRA
jgi:NAD(P)-dependent dehydrogenase (short-subunit alcohol dehydrogenase family)